MISAWTGIPTLLLSPLLGNKWKQKIRTPGDETIPFLMNFPLPTTIIEFQSPQLQMGDLMEATIRETTLPQDCFRILSIGKAVGIWEKSTIEWGIQEPTIIPIQPHSNTQKIFQSLSKAYLHAYNTKLKECIECDTCSAIVVPEHSHRGKYCLPCGLMMNAKIRSKKER